MSIQSTSDPATRMRSWRQALATRRVGPIGLAALALLCGAVASQPAEAAPKLRGDRGAILKGLAQAHKETPQALGLSGDGGVIEVLVSPEGGWTMLVTYPRRPTCVVTTGEAWQILQVAGEPA
jgi:hypothetical protein